MIRSAYIYFQKDKVLYIYEVWITLKHLLHRHNHTRRDQKGGWGRNSGGRKKFKSVLKTGHGLTREMGKSGSLGPPPFHSHSSDKMDT